MREGQVSTVGINNVTASSEILNSWKEIAHYLNRGVRTVQRWEAELRMPVRRPRGRGRSAVLAMRSELDSWVKSCPMEATGQLSPYKVPKVELELLRASTLELHRLRHEVSRSYGQLAVALNEMAARLHALAASCTRGAQTTLACAAAASERTASEDALAHSAQPSAYGAPDLRHSVRTHLG